MAHVQDKLRSIHKRLLKAPSWLSLEEVDALLIAPFLDDLEASR